MIIEFISLQAAWLAEPFCNREEESVRTITIDALLIGYDDEEDVH
ncbi:hypothetical protein PUW24_01280 [Paenibacillus urinalis]|uniref:Uncharacterized protein n=1 Tax=Paenibacillus urinalis TaxID=521520 RepID=A0AAX3MZ35_9BACL|nr:MULTISPECIES: hypothetical protein [Paenibacillus]WDH81622.1 hypothetical protein PUW23_19170 [Paenibacillus urinalis]WDH97665.1 hypothetical protein PUW24_01280 [Paenibacillus urinalis]WDI01339.1 hypothetical protein PUW25_19015 [Paenibacillus urinalis]GAK39590.1 hypothetical protein TCA2_2079 [Paenibacillus sp. TCA20]